MRNASSLEALQVHVVKCPDPFLCSHNIFSALYEYQQLGFTWRIVLVMIVANLQWMMEARTYYLVNNENNNSGFKALWSIEGTNWRVLERWEKITGNESEGEGVV